MNLFKRPFRSRKRTIFIGDVHGCLDELKDLLGKLRIRSSDRVIMLGDLINRGPHPDGVVRFVYENGFDMLMGNHEDEYLGRCQQDTKFINLKKKLGESVHRWIKERPLFMEEDYFLAVHAGLEPGVHPSLSKRDIILNIRTWDDKGEDIRNPGNPPWYHFYRGSKPVFYGHWARRGLTLRENSFGLDSGCVYGKQLSAYILEKKELVQVPARKLYYVPPSLRISSRNVNLDEQVYL